ncbi:MAG: hypothetical protein HC887_05375 [Desulfobacteraceae bacterium]|nr:hypothetical protein [Desulfobacteraceae bacterium]
MINFKQQELIENFVSAVEEQFPDVKFVDVTESPENPNDLWINVTRVRDEDRLIDLLDFCSEKSTDILMDYGYHMLVMAVR